MSLWYIELRMKVKWADHAGWKELSFKLVPLTGHHSKLSSHLTTYSFSLPDSILTLASIPFILIAILLVSLSSTSAEIFYSVDKLNMLCLIETSLVYNWLSIL
jgi:hypothetical protein